MRVRSRQESDFISDLLGRWSRHWIDVFTKTTDEVTTGIYHSIEFPGIYRMVAVDGEVHAQLLPNGKKYVWPLEVSE